MAQVAGIFIEHNAQGIPTYARIDLRKYGKDLMSFFKEKGVEIKEKAIEEEEVKFSKKMQESLAQAKRGEISIVDIDHFWDV
ncbi:MAG: hypothetical protein LBC47_02375 [Tannerella sp.]|jgi:hypothetical protein|nr:hypothetical protein [Tannerella sp.]